MIITLFNSGFLFKNIIMRIKKITYKRTFALPGYENKVVGVEAELNEGENPDECLLKSIAFVEQQSPANTSKKKNEELERKVRFPEEYEESEVLEAIKEIRSIRKNDLPF